jgi:LPS sulfotransferase NodH
LIDFDHPTWGFWEKGPVALRNGATTRDEFLDVIKRVGTTDNGVFGVKLMFNNLDRIVSNFHEMPQYAGLDRSAIFHAVFPNLHVIDVKRRDHLRQAISWARMAQTGLYVNSKEKQLEPTGEAFYDAEMIKAMIALIEEGERGWAEFYKELNLTPYEIVYEDLLTVEGMAGALRGLVRHLGVEPNFDRPPTPRSIVQADALTDEWVARYLGEVGQADKPAT